MVKAGGGGAAGMAGVATAAAGFGTTLAAANAPLAAVIASTMTEVRVNPLRAMPGASSGQ